MYDVILKQIYQSSTFGKVVALTALTAGFIAYRYSSLNQGLNATIASINDAKYATWKAILKNKTLPIGLVDKDAYFHNLEKLTKIVSDNNKKNKHKKTVRLATKSIRVPALIKEALQYNKTLLKGLMCYSAKEAQFLWQEKICDDFLIAYPTVQAEHLAILKNMHEAGAKVSLVLDSASQFELVSQAMADLKNPFPIVIELDVSLRLLDGLKHLGARRSPIHSIDDLELAINAAKLYKNIKVVGVMAYESAVAGLSDNNPHKSFIINSAASCIRQLSATRAAKMRAQVPALFKKLELSLQIFNGGGTGSIQSTAAEESGLTEISLGSGLYDPHFLDSYTNLKQLKLEPSLYFAIPVTRTSDQHYVTCFGGGYIASGSPGADKAPIVVSPVELEITADEGYGEVQTPFYMADNSLLKPGDPVICRPAKAGEAAGLFQSITLFSKKNNKFLGEELSPLQFDIQSVDTYKKYDM